LSPEEYAKLADVTAPRNYEYFSSKIIDPEIVHAWIGVSTETGESGDVVKKALIYGKAPDLINLDEEFGDKLWYIALYCNHRGITFSDLFEQNIAKLQQRFPDKYNEEDAINRDTTAERRVLEQTTLTREYIRQMRRSPTLGSRLSFNGTWYQYLMNIETETAEWIKVETHDPS
jgi:NTP pyrophosphatase (non-canonical NTP hydrolase)